MADGWAQYGTLPPGHGGPTGQPQVAVLEAVADADGTMTARLEGAASAATRLVRRITVSTPGATTATRAFVYVGEPAPETIVMGTRSGVLDVALENPPLFVPNGTVLAVQWDGTPTRALARIEYQES
jgi:hypothetical protein